MEDIHMTQGNLDCIVIGYNEMPFENYERLLFRYGENSEAYRDLKYSFVDIGDKKLNYVDLLNHTFAQAYSNGNGSSPKDEFKSGDIPSLAAVYLANFLKKRGFEAKYINLFQYEKEKLAEYLAQDPICVAITTTFYLINQPVIEMVDFIRDHNDEVMIIAGGPLIANHHRRHPPDSLPYVLDDIGADIYVIESQGENTLSEIVRCLKHGGSLEMIPNIVFLNDDDLPQMTAPRPENNSLDLNFINWQDFPDEELGPTLQTRTARSCAFSCAFCGYPARAGKLTLAGLDTIEEELDTMYALGDVENVVFIDDTFNVPLKRFKDICRLMIKKKYGFKWFSYFRCSNSDEEAIELMAEAGCKGVFLGIEAGSATILMNMNKAATLEKYIVGIQRLNEHDILTFGSFITGFPGETDGTVKETIDFINFTKPSYFRSQLWYCEPGTPIYSQRDKYNIMGEGFKWEHSTMNSTQAMDHIDQMYLSTTESTWLPQWSFDFWFIPYILGKGVTLPQFKHFMEGANKMLTLNIQPPSEEEKQKVRQEALQHITNGIRDWQIRDV